MFIKQLIGAVWLYS